MNALVREIDEAASLPAVIYEVMRVCDDPRSDAKKLAAAVAADPVLAAKLVRMSNSAFFGLVHKTSDLRSAVVRLGLKNVRNAAMGMTVAQFFDSQVESDGYSRPNVWKHSVAVATLNELLAGASKVATVRQMAPEAMLVGLVHDIGVILEDQYAPTRFSDLPALAWKLREPLHKVEKDDLGFDHQDLGRAVLKKWRFPERLTKAVGSHHRPGRGPENELASITAVGEMLAAAKKIGYYDVPRIDKDLFGTLAKRLGLGVREIGEVRKKFEVRLPQALEVFGAAAASA